MKAVAVISGGLDSTTMAYLLRRDGFALEAISFNYGQRHQKELRAARSVASELDARWTLIDLEAAGIARCLTGSALTDPGVAMPEGHYADESMRATVVPNRNAIMLTIATALAASSGAETVAFGAHAGDHPIYPDCRPEFVEQFQRMASIAMQGVANVRVIAPFIKMTKHDIVRLGRELGVPFEATWSCYKGGEKHCGRCGTCVERREAFEVTGIPDPTTYEIHSVAAQPR